MYDIFLFVCYYIKEYEKLDILTSARDKIRSDVILAKKKDPMSIYKREKAILRFIEKQVEEKGYAPSVREIGKAVGLKSTATVHGY